MRVTRGRRGRRRGIRVTRGRRGRRRGIRVTRGRRGRRRGIRVTWGRRGRRRGIRVTRGRRGRRRGIRVTCGRRGGEKGHQGYVGQEGQEGQQVYGWETFSFELRKGTSREAWPFHVDVHGVVFRCVTPTHGSCAGDTVALVTLYVWCYCTYGVTVAMVTL